MISDARGRHVSPGIYTEEKDVTYSVKSLGITSLGLAGETLYGPAFEPIEISEWSDFVDYFGGTDASLFEDGYPKYELPYIAKSYLEKSKRLSVVRVLGLSGYNAGTAWILKEFTTARTPRPLLILRSKKKYESEDGDVCNGGTDTPSEIVTNIEKVDYNSNYSQSICIGSSSTSSVPSLDSNLKFGIKVTLTDSRTVTYYVSLDKNDNDYIYNVLSSDPDKSDYIYIDSVFDIDDRETITLDNDFTQIGSIANPYGNFKQHFRAAQTPWIVSEAFITSGTTDTDNNISVKKLFRFITISDGDVSNYQIKVSFEKLDPVNGTFDVVVRDFNDSDNNPYVLERFVKCSLNRGDSSYIGLKIGTADGQFIPKSKYIVVDFGEENIGKNLSGHIPCGFLGFEIAEDVSLGAPYVNYYTEYDTTKRSKSQYFGMKTGNFSSDILKYHGQTNSEDTLYTKGFHMDSNFKKITSVVIDGEQLNHKFECVSNEKVTSDNIAPTITKDKDANGSIMNQSFYKDIKLRKFTVCFFGGFDGWDINRGKRTNTDEYNASKYHKNFFGLVSDYDDDLMVNTNFLNLPQTAITSDYYAYLAGYKCFANPDDIDINLFATPGINWKDNTKLTSDAIEVIEDKDDGRGGDTLYVMNCPKDHTVEYLVYYFNDTDIDTSYACTYYPWIVYYDSTQYQYVKLPATKDVVRNMADTDNISFPWYAPAGFTRGSVDCEMADFKTTLSMEDDLYSNMINPIKTFGVDGVKVWGNKTTYKTDSPLNRVNVRRLMIRVKKLVTSAARNLIFEQYSDTLEKQFRSLVEPILSEVKSNRGISDYRIVTEVTPETRDQHILPAKILIKPTPALEYISISFVVYPESVEFESE